jgi:hypothetical protein
LGKSHLLWFSSIGWSRYTTAELYHPHFFRYHHILQLFMHHRRHQSHWTSMSQRQLQAVCKSKRFTIFIIGARHTSIPIGQFTVCDSG